MIYTKTTLLKDEQVIFFTKPHFMIFAQPAVWLVGAILVTPFGPIFRILGLLFFVMGLLQLGLTLIRFLCTEYVITNKRVIMKVGFISRTSLELFLQRIEGIYLSQGIVGRILDYGTVSIGGIGGSRDNFYYIPEPVKFRNIAQEQIEKTSKIV